MLQKTETAPETSSEEAPLHPQPIELLDEPKVNTILFSPAVMEDLNRYVKAGVARNRRRSKILQRLNQIYGMCWMAAWYLSITHDCAYLGWLIFLGLISWFFRRVAFYAGMAGWARSSQSTEYDAAKQLIASENVEAAPALIDMLYWVHTKPLRSELWQALARLLPRLSAEQAQELGEERHGILVAWIDEWHLHYPLAGNTLLPGILHVLGAVGKRSIQTRNLQGEPQLISLMTLLSRWAKGEAGQDPALLQAVHACQEAIEQKIALARSGEQLLRAASAPTTGADILLRPARGTVAPPVEELLRPGSPEALSEDAGKGKEG